MDGCRHENKTISLDQDYNIPDMKPDAKMIIREQGDIVNLECRSMGEKFGIKGEMSFQILYTAEENGQLACLRGSIPFEETLAVKMGERDEDYEVQVRVEKLNVRLINSRKTNITAILGIDLVDQKVCDVYDRIIFIFTNIYFYFFSISFYHYTMHTKWNCCPLIFF